MGRGIKRWKSNTLPPPHSIPPLCETRGYESSHYACIQLNLYGTCLQLTISLHLNKSR